MRKSLLIILLLFVGSFTSHAEDRQSFVGAWELLRIDGKDDNGRWKDLAPEGTKFIGSIMYSASGMMQAQLFLSDRNNEILKDYPKEFVDGYVAYFAIFSVDDENNIVTHKRLGHINSESVIDVQRSYIFKDDLLTLSPLPSGNVRLVWKRVEHKHQ